MGGSSSRIIVMDDEKKNPIQVTREVVERIKELEPQKSDETPKSEIAYAPVRKREKVSTEHLEKLVEQNQELRRLLLSDSIISDVQFIDEKQVVLPKMCINEQQNILNCLQNNRKTPLNCSSEMSEFTKCVYSERKSIL